MKHLEDKDIREALRRKESRRQEPEEPADFLDKVMDKINLSYADSEATLQQQVTTGSKMRPMFIILSVAASIALLVLLAWPRFNTGESGKQDQSPLTATTAHPQQGQSNDTNKEKAIDVSQPVETVTPAKEYTRLEAHTAPVRGATIPQRKKNQPVIVSTDGTDSLQYYIDKIERELAVVDESLYIDRINKVIRADERLQRIVDSYILHQIDEEGRPQTAANMSNVKKQENEDK